MWKIFTFLGFVALSEISGGQTLHIDDFDYFVGCFAGADLYAKESIDCSKFVEWRILKPDSDKGRRDLGSIEYSADKFWVYDWEPLSSQSRIPGGGKYRQNSGGLEFYILMDFFGHERQRNVLTVWERIGKDSLRYHCGQAGDFDSFIGASRVERVRTFPDQSILLVVRCGGEGYQGYKFFRGSPECDFKSFYERRWSIPYGEGGGSYTSLHYNFEHMRGSSYNTTEVSEYISIKPIDLDYGLRETIVDSASVRIIDVWDMAKIYFGIDSK